MNTYPDGSPIQVGDLVRLVGPHSGSEWLAVLTVEHVAHDSLTGCTVAVVPRSKGCTGRWVHPSIVRRATP